MKSKSTVNKAGNYTKPTMRKRLFSRIKAGGKGGRPGQWSARKAQMLASAYKKSRWWLQIMVAKIQTIKKKIKQGKKLGFSERARAVNKGLLPSKAKKNK